MDVHYKHDQQAPMTACGITDDWVIWSSLYEQITCVKCVDMMDMMPA